MRHRIIINAPFPDARKTAKRLGSSDKEIDELFAIVDEQLRDKDSNEKKQK